MPISVVINTYNSSRTLSKVLEAVKGFDEIVVCDMESTDNTVELARQGGARVVTFPKKHYNYADPARNYAIHQARHDWVLVIDHDEVVTPELRQALYKFIKHPGEVKGVYIPRRNFILDRFRRSTYPDYQLRFFHRENVNWPAEFHSEPEVYGEVTKLPSNRQELALIHIPASIDHLVNRIKRYAAADLTNAPKKRVTLAHVALLPFATFFNTYVLKGSARYGVAGFIAAATDSIGTFYRHAKRYEHNVRHNLAGGYDGELPALIAEDKREHIPQYEQMLIAEENQREREFAEKRDSDSNL
ncbi:MAG: glycosyltransferase family 2 protein [Muribaculaceae bacterium]|nr:glycosyltransferase family 2 protein [Muribaculaceae bacterium]MDE7108409.1 glycosyltransferase family 2 protein [Muribaculaceae bacterium]